jgi:hypothetical protein
MPSSRGGEGKARTLTKELHILLRNSLRNTLCNKKTSAVFWPKIDFGSEQGAEWRGTDPDLRTSTGDDTDLIDCLEHARVLHPPVWTNLGLYFFHIAPLGAKDKNDLAEMGWMTSVPEY